MHSFRNLNTKLNLLGNEYAMLIVYFCIPIIGYSQAINGLREKNQTGGVVLQSKYSVFLLRATPCSPWLIYIICSTEIFYIFDR